MSRTTCTIFSKRPASSKTGEVDAANQRFNDGSKSSAYSLRQVAFDISRGQPAIGTFVP